MNACFPLPDGLYETCMKKAFKQVPVSARSAVFSRQSPAPFDVHLRELTCTSANEAPLGGKAENNIQLRSKNLKSSLRFLSIPFPKPVLKPCLTRVYEHNGTSVTQHS
jgi:hypothetical protein